MLIAYFFNKGKGYYFLVDRLLCARFSMDQSKYQEYENEIHALRFMYTEACLELMRFYPNKTLIETREMFAKKFEDAYTESNNALNNKAKELLLSTETKVPI